MEGGKKRGKEGGTAELVGSPSIFPVIRGQGSVERGGHNWTNHKHGNMVT